MSKTQSPQALSNMYCGNSEFSFSIHIDYHADAISETKSMHQIVRGNANDDKSNRPSPLPCSFQPLATRNVSTPSSQSRSCGRANGARCIDSDATQKANSRDREAVVSTSASCYALYEHRNPS